MPPQATGPSVINSKPQKSTLWIWTSLWLTTFIDSFLIAFLLVILLRLVEMFVPSLAIMPMVLQQGLTVLLVVCSAAIGAYYAARFVLKRSIILKTQANYFALLSLIMPFLGLIVLYVFLYSSISQNGLDYVTLLEHIGILVVIYGIIRSMIANHGD